MRARWVPATLLLLAAALHGGVLGRGAEESSPGPSRYGVNAHVPSREDLRAISRAGFGWVRVDLTWNWVEPQEGLFRFDELDRLAADARAEGVNLLGILGYCPPWASSGPDIFYPPRETAAWKNYVRAMVGRYRGSVRCWSLWNEPNCNTYFRGTVRDYIERVMVPGVRAVKEADPGAPVCGPDLAHLSGCGWDAWMGAILAEPRVSFDIISHHCYRDTPGEVFKQLEGPKWFWEPDPVLDILKRHGQGAKPFFLTEVGWRSNRVGEAAQASNDVEVLEGMQRRPWLSKVFLYELKDSAQEPGFGLLRPDRSPKPAYRAVRRFIRRKGE